MDDSTLHHMIWYYAGNFKHSFSTLASYEAFCGWATSELTREFPDHIAAVVDNDHPDDFDTNDNENREQIIEFCSHLFERYAGRDR